MPCYYDFGRYGVLLLFKKIEITVSKGSFLAYMVMHTELKSTHFI